MKTTFEQYKKYLNTFKEEVIEKIPKDENPVFSIVDASPILKMQYGPTVVEAILITTSSGIDKYLIWITQEGYPTFIRNIET